MSTAYETILEETRAASRKFATVQEDYRAGRIGDEEYLAGRAEYAESDRAFDIARDELSPAALGATMNQNKIKYDQGYRYRLEVTTSNLARCEPEFTKTKRAATTRRSILREVGYGVTVFKITETGGLTT